MFKTNDYEFLKRQISDSEFEINGVKEWVESGKWKDHQVEFLSLWLGDKWEKERNGRTNEQMASDLCKELVDMGRKAMLKMLVVKELFMTVPEEILKRSRTINPLFFEFNIISLAEKMF